MLRRDQIVAPGRPYRQPPSCDQLSCEVMDRKRAESGGGENAARSVDANVPRGDHMHTPAMQFCPNGQRVPHAPQLKRSVCKFAHVAPPVAPPGHMVDGAVQPHAPAAHV